MKDAAEQAVIANRIKTDYVQGRSPLPPQLNNFGCLSMAALSRFLSDQFEQAGLPPLKGTLALARASHLYDTARELKHFVQGINANTLPQYQGVIDEAKN